LENNLHYIVKDNNIAPVDYENTGCIMTGVHWGNGLHQFLQIKHNLPISIEGMTSNFISNLGHFDKYSLIYGLTGNLQSKYNVNSSF
jgi:preprotein translocase subunit SecA